MKKRYLVLHNNESLIESSLLTDSIIDTLIHPLRIPTPFAVGDVFSYLITDEKIVLVDCGQFTEDAFSVIKKHLKDHGLSVGDLDEIWLTHGHPDHFGQADRLATRSGAVVFGHPLERANFAGNIDGHLFREFFAHHHIPEKYTGQMIEQLDWLRQFQQPIEPEWINEGDTLRSGELIVSVRKTPGHAPGHVVFATDEGVIFGGDLLLDHISTNALINFDPDTEKRNKSLPQYRESLQWIRKKTGRVLPGHGRIIENIQEVADHHLHEHEKRYKKIQQLLEGQPQNLLELSYKMFPDAIRKGAVFLVLSEVLGYLDWGEAEGTISKEVTSDGVEFIKT
ncbi:MAG TPA: MBL fold metallo-hydrolase [Balneolaceae bacterium]|nr:MBL fold metallo-hydrolase [Balneolaceae bacterium]